MVLKNNLQISIFGLLATVLISSNLLGMQKLNHKPVNNSINHLLKNHGLPNRGGLIRYIPPKVCLNQGLPISRANGQIGFKDKFGNVWVKGPSRTANEEFEWDVQLAKKNKNRMKSLAANDGNHVNVSLKGIVTHY